MNSVYSMAQKFKSLTDKRQRKSISFHSIIMSVFLSMLLQYESFHAVFSSPESMKKRLRHLIKGKVPGVDAVRDVLERADPGELEEILDQQISHIYQNRVLRKGTIDGYTAAAIDGVELFSSTKKSYGECLTRKTASGQTEHFCRSVVCATVGADPHIILGQDMLKPRDGNEKDEG